MLAMDVIELVRPEWASPIVFELKKDGHFDSIWNIAGLMPQPFRAHIHFFVCIYSLGDATQFYTVDANRSYWQLEGPDRNRVKSHFFIPSRTIPNHSNAIWLRKHLRRFNTRWISYYPRIIGSSNSWILVISSCYVFKVSRKKGNRQALTFLEDTRITLELKKCNFFTNHIDTSGHVIKLRHWKSAHKHSKWIEPYKNSLLYPDQALSWVWQAYFNGMYQVLPELQYLLSANNEKTNGTSTPYYQMQSSNRSICCRRGSPHH